MSEERLAMVVNLTGEELLSASIFPAAANAAGQNVQYAGFNVAKTYTQTDTVFQPTYIVP
ncbi:MAG: hypothetical protein HC834_08055, partial [Rhodospirillales bacterium]|nr:hypothetical protein [Rhodospirillales bacterium]